MILDAQTANLMVAGALLVFLYYGSAEYTVVRTYIDWILDVPWRDHEAEARGFAPDAEGGFLAAGRAVGPQDQG